MVVVGFVVFELVNVLVDEVVFDVVVGDEGKGFL